MNMETVIWIWIYMGMAAAILSLGIVLWAILYDHKK